MSSLREIATRVTGSQWAAPAAEREYFDYLTKQGIDYESLSEGDKEESAILFFDYKKKLEIRDNTEKAARRSTSGVDFSTDILKANDRLIDAEGSLKSYITNLKSILDEKGKTL